MNTDTALPSAAVNGASATDAAPPDHQAELASARTEFFEESRDAIAVCEQAIAALHADPDDRRPLSDVFNAIHTVKGSASILGFPIIATLTHAMETAIEVMLDGPAPPGDPELGLLATATALLDDLLAARSAGRNPDLPEVDDLIARLEELKPRPAQASDTAARLGDRLVSTGAAERLAVELAAAEQVLGNRQRLGEILIDRGDATPSRVAAAIEAQKDAIASATSVRVEVSLLDDLMGLIRKVGESAAEVDRLVRNDAPTSRILAAAGAARAAADVAEDLMRRSRRQPMRVVWRRLPRIVALTAADLGKQVEVTTVGEDLVVDTLALQAIIAPVTHLIRNAIDHGIETPSARIRAGKPATGELALRADLDGPDLVVEVADDGAGFDLEAIKATALDKALIGPATAARLTDSELAELVFLAGLSTADAVTRISGRGVGLDVVRAEVTRLGGSLAVQSRRGEGTVFTLRIPEHGDTTRGQSGGVWDAANPERR
ncbi:MAG: chemotaxis protein CheA [Acidimicrobiales bacterium]